jgi:hypothetical protein
MEDPDKARYLQRIFGYIEPIDIALSHLESLIPDKSQQCNIDLRHLGVEPVSFVLGKISMSNKLPYFHCGASLDFLATWRQFNGTSRPIAQSLKILVPLVERGEGHSELIHLR